MLSRRRRALLGVVIGLATIAAACGGDDDTAEPEGSPSTAGPESTAAAQTTGGGTEPSTTPAGQGSVPDDADPNGVIRVGFGFLRSGHYSFDPRLYNGNNASFYQYMLFAPLVKVNPRTLEYTPYLAESFEVVDPQT